MKCNQHSQLDAVGLCVGCGRALCKRCIRTSREDEIVCSDLCERKSLQILALRQAEAGRYAIEAATMSGASLVCRLMAVACSIAALANLFFTFVVPQFAAVRGAMKPIPAAGFGVIMFLFSAILVGAARIARSLSNRYWAVVGRFDEQNSLETDHELREPDYSDRLI